ncbi:MAG: PAS domain S-box protein [Pseudomonadota bacterium]
MLPCNFFKTTVKTKSILLVAVVITILSTFYTSHQFAYYTRHIESHLTEQRQDFQHIFSSTQHLYFSIYNSWLTGFNENHREIIQAFAEKDREKLFSLTLPLYQSLKKSHPDIHIMHFHEPDGRSFLRMHKPDLFGDDLKQIRPAVQHVNTTHKPLTGYEIGVFGCFYRIIHPVFHNGDYVGAVELGVNTDEIIDEITRATGNHTAAFFQTSLWKKVTTPSASGNRYANYTLVENKPNIGSLLPSTYSFSEEFSQFKSNGKHYLALTIPGLLNPFQEPIGGIISLKDISNEINEKKSFMLQSLVVSISLGMFCIFFLCLSFQKIIGSLEKSKDTQEELIDQLNREIDIRREAEKALEQNEIKQRHILNSLPDTIFLLDENRIVTWANESALTLTPDFIGRECDFCGTGAGPSPENCSCRQAFTSSTILKSIIHRPATAEQTQKTYWEAILIPQIDDQGTVTGALVVLRDITERMEAIRKIEKLSRHNRLLLESAGEGIYGVDLEGKTTFMNPAAERMTGFTEKEMLGKNQHELLHHTRVDGSCYPVKECPVHTTMHTRKPHFITDEVFWKKDGSSFPVEYIATPVVEEGRIIGSVVLFSDITHRKLLEKQLLHAQKMEAVGRLTSGIAHDFNNLLTTISGYSEIILMQTEENNPVRDKVQMIFQAGRMAASLTRQLLAFSRKQVLEIRTINLNNIVESLTKMLQRLIGENIRLKIEFSQPDCFIEADPGQCEQIIMNLAINAKDAMPTGGSLGIMTGIVHLRATKLTGFDDIDSGSYVLLQITDTGEGMTEETQKLMFEPFFTTKEQGKGTGLGLATVYGIIKQHNGFISVKSAPGQGTSFDIYFPLSRKKLALKDMNTPDILPRGTETILVVDDTPTIRLFIRDTLEPLGYNILEAGNAEEAIHYHEGREKSIDLLLTDMVMPGLSGIQLAEAMQPLHAGMKTLYMSGHVTYPFTEDKNIHLGNHFIQKPLSPRQVALKVRNVLDCNSEDTNISRLTQ